SANGSAVATLDDGTKLPIASGNGERAVTVGIRPEAYRRDPEGPLTLSVAVVEPTGPEIHVFGTIAGEDVRVVLRDRDLPKPGEELRLSVPVEHVHLFDTDSGRRLGAGPR